jgi:cytochrome c-type biogenesis protein
VTQLTALTGVLHADPLGLLVAFGAGMLSFLSPCVLPLVPAYVSMVSGLSAAELSALGSSPTQIRAERARLFRGMLTFIAGFTVVFTILGASASAIGRLFLTHQRMLETVAGIAIVVFGAILVAMAAGVGLPMAVAGERRFRVRPSVLGAWAPPVMGMAFAFAWTPCIGPVLGSVLALAAGEGGSETGGIALLLAYSLGLGVPFLLSGLLFGRMTDAMARVRGRLRVIDLVGGVVLIGFGILLLTGNVDVLSAHIANWLRDLHLSRLSTS